MNMEISAMNAERTTLNTLMFSSPKSWVEHWKNLHEDLFLDARNKQIFRAISVLYTQNITPEASAVQSQLEVMPGHEVDEPYLAGLIAVETSLTSLPYHIDTLIDCDRRRKTEQVLTESLVQVRDRKAGADITALLDDVAANITKINSSQNTTNNLQPVETALHDVMQTILQKSNGEYRGGLKTNLIEVDRLIGNMEAGDYVVIGARPSMGKTTLLVDLIKETTLSANKPSLFMSAEMTRGSITERLISSVGGVPLSAIRSGQCEDQDWENINEATRKLVGKAIEINDTPRVQLSEIRESARKVKNKYGCIGAIFVDYLQLIQLPNGRHADNEHARLTEVSNELKAIAKDFECPVISLAQLNRDLEKRPNKRPVMADLRGSGSIEQDADIIMFIYRDEVYNQKTEEPGIAEIIVAKQRNGAIGTAKIAADLAYSTFRNLDWRGGAND